MFARLGATIKQYPPVLWALSIYLLSLGFDLRFDIPLALFVAVTVYFLASAHDRMISWRLLQTHWPVLLFLVGTLVATVFSVNRDHSLAVQVQFLPALLVYVVVVCFVDDKGKLDFVLSALVLSALFLAAVFFVRLLFNELQDPMEKVIALRSSFFTVPNDALFLSVVAPLAVALILTHTSRVVRGFCVAYLILAFAMTVYLQSRQAVGVFIFSLFFMAFLYRPKLGLWVGGLGILIALSLDWLLGKGLASKLVLFFPRQYVWGAAWEMFLERPVTGWGPGMFKDHYFEFLEKAGYLLVEDHRPMKWAHSLYFEQLAERGMVGLTVLVIFMGSAILIPGRAILAARGDVTWLAKGVLTACLAFLLAGIAEASLLRLWTVHLLFFLAAVTNYFHIKNNELGRDP